MSMGLLKHQVGAAITHRLLTPSVLGGLGSFFFFLIFIYLAVSCLSCSTWDLHCSMCGLSLQHAGYLLRRVGFSLVAAHGLSCPATCGILVPRPGIESASPALEVQILNHWATREVPV